MPLGRVIAEVRDDLRNRVEVSWHHETWHVTASSFETALAYTNDRFDDPVVLSRHDHGRRRVRVTLDVTTDQGRAPQAPPLEALAHASDQTAAPEASIGSERPSPPATGHSELEDEPTSATELPEVLEAIFASQNTGR
jgi:hypothetical protein